MTRKILLVATLLLVNLVGTAAAAEYPEQTSKPSKYARNTLILLKEMGVTNTEITEFVRYVDQKVDHNMFRIAQAPHKEGTLSLNYAFSSHNDYIGKKGLVLEFKPIDSHWEYVAGTHSIMAHYQLKF